MPTAALSPCGSCGVVGCRGSCESRRQQEPKRPSAADRGYDHNWQRFRPYFISMLIARGIVPVCGATLPTGPVSYASRCKAAGFLTGASSDGSSLHLDHEPQLTPEERKDPAKVCDPNRIVLLCDQCHNAKSEHHR